MSDVNAWAGNSVASAVDVVRRVPNKYREFTADPAELRRLHRIDKALLQQLLDCGLPHRVSGDVVFIDSLDAENLSLLLGLRSRRRVSMRWWGVALRNADLHQAKIFTMRIAGEADRDLEGLSYSLNPKLIASALPSSVVRVSPDVFTVQARLPRPARPFGPEFGPLIAELSQLRFHMLPSPLRDDLGFMAESGLADCRLATRFAVARAAQLGLPVRRAEGLLVIVPYPTRHCWVEFEAEDGEWVAADPFMLSALAQWGIVDPGQWPPSRSPQSVLWRLGSDSYPLIVSEGRGHGCMVAILSEVPADDSICPER